MVPCIHALGFQEFKAFARQGVTRLLANDSHCSACPASAGVTLDQTISRFNLIQQSRGAPIIHVERLPAETWHRTLNALRKKPQMPDPRRRRFLGLGAAEPQPSQPPERRKAPPNVEREDWLYSTLPQIDPARCNGCDACVRMCPHDVFTLAGAASDLHYSLDPDECTGCGLCSDICDQDAISLHCMTTQQQWRVSLQSGRCSDCGAPFHMPRRNDRKPERCRICAGKSHHNRLFQTIKQ
jgi:ferredoxin